ncbi:MAG: SufD family Fe-S cluster assembly protein, partial [Candidatus Dadabacteria bacterium]
MILSELLEAGNPEGRGYPVARARAAQILRERGLPGTHGVEERYRQIDLRAVLQADWQLRGEGGEVGAEGVETLLEQAPPSVRWRLVTINGLVAPELTELPEGVTWRRASECADQGEELTAPLESLYQDNPFVAANVVLGDDAIELTAAGGVRIDEPVGLIHLRVGLEGVVAAPRVCVSVESGAVLTLVECWISDGASLVLPVTQIDLDEGAHLRLLRLQNEAGQATHIAATLLRACGEGTTFEGLALDFGAALHRHDVVAELDGSEERITWNGLALIGGEQVNDIHARMEHRAPGSESNQLYKIVLDDRAHAIFSGRVVVQQAAQQTNAFQASPAVLLSDDAWLQTNPELEIYADDVRCTHGATCGELDEQALFYLRARGLGRQSAEALLLYGFVQEVL